jgi:hypothetical protein
MSIGSIVKQLTLLTRIEPLMRHAGTLPGHQRGLWFGGMALAVAVLGACEQQVANAEQPAGVSGVQKSDGLAQESAKAVRNDRGKLVFEKAACELPNKGGEVTGECSVIGRVSSERKGHLTYGPYLPLAAGEYAFEIDYRSSADAASNAGRWDVAARLGADEQVIATGGIPGTANNVSVLAGRFSMPSKQGGVPVLEIRAAPSPTAETEIKRLRIYEVTAAR